MIRRRVAWVAVAVVAVLGFLFLTGPGRRIVVTANTAIYNRTGVSLADEVVRFFRPEWPWPDGPPSPDPPHRP